MVKYVKPSFEILAVTQGIAKAFLDKTDGYPLIPFKLIEAAGRTCYKSEDKINETSAMKFVKMIVERGHLSVIEHVNVTVKFISNRGFTHELVRHRLASYSQESTRYCNYGKEKFGSEITVIDQMDFIRESCDDAKEFAVAEWKKAMQTAEDTYFQLIRDGVSPQIARGVLPIDTKTEIVMTANLREWGHVFKMRASPQAHPNMQELMYPLLDEFKKMFPGIYDNLEAF